MAGKVVGWAFEQGRERDLPPTQRYVLIAYGDNASELEGKCWPDKPEIVEKTGLSQATVYRAIKALEEQGLLRFVEDSKGRDCVYLSVPWNSQSEKDFSQSEKDDSHSEKRSNKGTVKEPSKTQRRVNRKVVSKAELDLTAAVVSLFNSVAGTKLRVDPHLTPIVGRIREWPQLTATQHGKIIEAVFAGEHWWSGPPGPGIIYGNAAQFERSIERARQAAKDGSKAEDPNAERRRVEREFREAEVEEEVEPGEVE